MSQIALVTGATGGIGKAIAIALAKQGYRVIIHGRNLAKLEALLRELNIKHGSRGEHKMLQADLDKAEERVSMIEAAFDIAQNCGGKLDLLVNNAGISHFGDFALTQAGTIEALAQTNFVAPIMLSQHYLNTLQRKQQVGTLINLGSALGSIGFPGFSVYCATKFGLRGFTETLAREYQASGNRIAYFAPRTTDTSINSKAASQMNQTMGSKVDSVDDVAQAFMSFLNGKSRRKVLGWPETFFARLNGVLPELVDKAFIQKTKKIKQFTSIPTGETK